jgi:hypothetical protein
MRRAPTWSRSSGATTSPRSPCGWTTSGAQAYHSGPLGSDPEALRFNALFPRNGEWHYVDLPLGVQAYELNGDYERGDDVVHELEAAIAVLEGTGDKRISPREALCMVVHFVGDLHQPLHVGNGVFATAPDGTAKLVEDPVAAKGLPNDKGGNADFFGPGKYDELHGYWDFELVQKIAGFQGAGGRRGRDRQEGVRRGGLVEECRRLPPLARGLGDGKPRRRAHRICRHHLRGPHARWEGRDQAHRHYASPSL